MMNSHLPSGWHICTISDVAKVNPSKITAEPDLVAGFVPMSLAPTDFNGQLQFEEKPWGEIQKSYTNFQNGDVIFAKVTPCFENGKAAIVDDLPNGIGAGSSEFYVLRPEQGAISNRLLFALLKTNAFAQNGAENMTGAVGLRRVPRAFVEGFEFPLPPLAEQKIIADKLDTLLAQVETTKARLERIPEIIKRFRQSVLSAAVSGKLTEKWRGSSKYEIQGNKLLPFGWKSEPASMVCLKVQSGSTPRDNPFDQNGTIPFLKVYNIVNQKIDFDYKPQFVTEDVHKSSLKRSIAQPNDVLMNIVGPPLGKVAVLTDQYPEWNLNQAITLFRADPSNLHHLFLYHVLCEGELVREVMPDTKGSVGQVNISLSQCRDALLPIPPLAEQAEIVRRVEQLFVLADSIEQKATAALARVNNLTQSILAKAFRGELTAEWRTANPEFISGDNSAAALLEKIKAERAALAPTKKSRVSKKV